MAQKKYVSLNKLSTFLDNLKNLFASKENMESLETVVSNEVNNLQSTIGEINDNVSQKSQVQIITWGVDD